MTLTKIIARAASTVRNIARDEEFQRKYPAACTHISTALLHLGDAIAYIELADRQLPTEQVRH